MAKKKYYAIKKGKDTENKIVNTWKECSEIVLGYDSIYKSFSTLEEAQDYLLVPVYNQKRPKKKKTDVMSIEIPEDLYADFIKKCASLGMTQEMIIKSMIEEWLE